MTKSWINECRKFLPELTIADLRDNRRNPTVNVFITQKSVLRKESEWRRFLAKRPPRYVIIDECHDWIRGNKSGLSKQLRFWREELLPLPRVEAVYGLSGTIVMGEPKWDLCESIKSIAPEHRRRTWSNANGETEKYTDAALKMLYDNWDKIDVTEKQNLLVPILLLRNEFTIIDGQPAMKNYRAMLVPMPEARIPLSEVDVNNERQKREEMVRQVTEGNPTAAMVFARWLAWSSWLVTRNWIEKGRGSKNWWNEFTLDDAKEFARGRKFVSVLQKIKRYGGRPIIFAEYIFLLEYAAKVPTSIVVQLMKGGRISRF